MSDDSTKRLDDYISSMGPTKEWLESRGLTSISELDEVGREELKKHLEDRLAQARAQNG